MGLLASLGMTDAKIQKKETTSRCLFFVTLNNYQVRLRRINTRQIL